MAKTRIINIMASMLIGRTYNPSCNDFIQYDKYNRCSNQLEKYSTQRRFCVYLEPVFWIQGITLPEPPDYHSEELKREENIHKDIEQPSCFFGLVRKRQNICTKSSGSVFKDGDREEKTAEHKTYTPDQILIVEKTHADSGWKTEEKP
jgi:hypothetical protein